MARSILFFFLCTVSLTLFLLFTLSIDTQWIGPFFSSDALYLADVTADLASGRPMDNWFLTPAPYFFPDGILYLLLALLEDNLRYQILFTAVFQYGALIAVTALLYRKLGLNGLWAPIGGSILLLISASGIDQDPFRATFLAPSGPVFVSAHHFSAFLLTLLFYAGLPPLKQATPKKLWPLALLVALMAASDLLFVLTAVLPYGILYIFQHRHVLSQEVIQRKFNWQAHRSPLILAIATVLGLLLKGLLMPKVTTGAPFHIGVDRLPDMLLIVQDELKHWFDHSPLVGLSWLTGIIILFTMAFRDKHWRLLAVLWLIANLLVLLAQLTIIDHPNARYMQLLLFMPLLLIPGGILLISSKLLPQKHLQNSLLILCSCGMLYWGAGLWQRLPATPAILNYYPESIACLDQVAKEKGLRSGVSGYWLSRSPSLLSRTGLQVLPVTQQLQPYYWIVNKNDFRDAPPLQFVIIDKHRPAEVNIEQLTRLAGKPDQIADCPTTTVWIYDNSQLEQALRTRLAPSDPIPPGQQLIFKASTLRTGDSGRLIGERITTIGATGTLVFGPYQKISPGNYEAHYVLSGENTEGIRWDALLHYDGQATTLAKGLLTNANNALPIQLEVEHNGSLEIRLFVDKQHNAQVHQLRLTRTD